MQPASGHSCVPGSGRSSPRRCCPNRRPDRRTSDPCPAHGLGALAAGTGAVVLRRASARTNATIGSMSDVAVTDNKSASQLEIKADGEIAELVYRTRAGRLILVHTEVPET